jgi:membrane protein implicated in regulation of membrane protease activity
LSTRKLAKKITGEEVRSINVDEIIGKEAIVIEQIDNKLGKGVVKVSGDMWRAVSVDDDVVIQSGEKVIIEKVEGAHVVVRPLFKPKEFENLKENKSDNL